MTKCALIVCMLNSIVVVFMSTIGQLEIPLYHETLLVAWSVSCGALFVQVRRRPDRAFAVAAAFTALLLIVQTSTNFLPVDDEMRFVWAFPALGGILAICGPYVGALALGASIVAIILANRSLDVIPPQAEITIVLALITTFVTFMLVLRQFFRTLKTLDASRAELRRMAMTDPLTGIANRQALQDKLQDLIAGGEVFSLVLLDLDRFKSINDTYGHTVGDVVLKEAARSLVEAVRPKDLVARFGGEEFAVLLVGVDPKTAEQRTEEMRLALAERAIVAQGHRVDLTGSFGIANSSEDRRDAARLLSSADAALYAAKNAGRNRWCVAA